jgi:hypothetical protein
MAGGHASMKACPLAGLFIPFIDGRLSINFTHALWVALAGNLLDL